MRGKNNYFCDLNVINSKDIKIDKDEIQDRR